MRALTSVLESDEVGQAQVCRAPPEERLASSRAQTAASVWTKQNAFTRQRGQPSSVQCYDFLFNVSVLPLFFYNFVMSSSVVSVEDHQQTFRSHVSELMDGRSCRRAGPFPLVVWTRDRPQQCFSRFHGFSFRFHRGGPLAGTLLWSLHWQAGVARQREQLLSCSAVHTHLNRCTSHMDVVVPLWLKRCQVSIKTRCVRLNTGKFLFSFFCHEMDLFYFIYFIF